MQITKNGKVVGTFKNGIYRKRVSRKLHLYRADDGWAISKDILNDLEGCREIRVLDTDTNQVYKVDFKVFNEHGKFINFGDEQLVLPLRYWECVPYQGKSENSSPTTRSTTNVLGAKTEDAREESLGSMPLFTAGNNSMSRGR